MVKYIFTYFPSKRTSRILINQKDVNGDTPLHLLIIKNGFFVPELIKHKDVNTMTRNNQNWTPCVNTIIRFFILKYQV